METEIQGSSPSNSIDHIDMDSLESDSDEEEYVDGIPHTDGTSYANGISYTDMISYADMIPHADGMPHTDMISYPYMIPPRTKRTDRPI
jgi:hypothetical protein